MHDRQEFWLKLGGLQVWFSPELFEKSREATLAYLVHGPLTKQAFGAVAGFYATR